MSHRSSIPTVAWQYFAQAGNPVAVLDVEHPVIHEVFWSGKGWKRHPLRKRVSVSELRRLRSEGAVNVTLRANGRTAEFSIKELLAREAR